MLPGHRPRMASSAKSRSASAPRCRRTWRRPSTGTHRTGRARPWPYRGCPRPSTGSRARRRGAGTVLWCGHFEAIDRGGAHGACPQRGRPRSRNPIKSGFFCGPSFVIAARRVPFDLANEFGAPVTLNLALGGVRHDPPHVDCSDFCCWHWSFGASCQCPISQSCPARAPGRTSGIGPSTKRAATDLRVSEAGRDPV